MALETQQYRDSRNLSARFSLHQKYGRTDWYSWLADRFTLSENAQILDVGCGPGWFWESMSAKLPTGAYLVLTDLSFGMVSEARRRLVACSRDSSFGALQANATRLPFPDGQFNLVFAMHMLYHLAEPSIAIAEMERVLGRGGQLVVTTNGKRNLSSIYSLSARAFGGEPYDPIAKHFDLAGGEACLRDRFGEVQVSTLTDEYNVRDPVDIFAYLTSMPPGQTGDAYERARLRSIIEDEMAQRAGLLQAELEVGVIVAHKRA